MAKQTVIFDFDGVIHSYTTKWQNAAIIPDPPVPGIKEAIYKIREHYRVVIVSSRCYQKGGIEAIKDWLKKYEIVVDDITDEKPPAVVIVDDRAITFDGRPEKLYEKIKAFKPWHK
jgi:beta-phosphoglucomutase-like phosphatase (HAD superfamily)